MTRRLATDGGDPAVVISPCINVCKLEEGLCIGCYRTIDEIALWGSVDDDDKRLILAAVARRRNARDPDADLASNRGDTT